MPSGEFFVPVKCETTFSRLMAFCRRVTLGGLDLLLEEDGLGLKVEVHEQPLDGFRAHPAFEVVAEPLSERPVDDVIRHQLLDAQVLERAQHMVEVLGLLAGALGELLDIALGLAAGGGELRALRPFGLHVAEPVLQLGQALGDGLVALGVDLAFLHVQVVLDLGEVLVPAVDVDPGDDVAGEVDDLFEVLRGKVEQVAQAGGDALEVPDVRDGRGEFDVPHPVAADLRPGDLHAAPLADDALEPDTLVLAAVAFPVAGGTEDALAEEPVLLRLQRPGS